MEFYNYSASEVFQKLKTDKNGLTDTQVEERLVQYGKNEITDKSAVSSVRILIKQLDSFLVWILLAAAGISFLIDHRIDAYVILIIVIANTAIGFFQEYRAEKAVEALKNMLIPHAQVIRNGQREKVNSELLVPGDIIVLEEGDSIPADAYLIEAANLRTVEASLTGESEPASKHTGKIAGPVSPSDCYNMVRKGTYVAAGSARAVITATGEDTELGKIAESLQDIKVGRTNFQQKVRVLAKQLAVFSVVVSALLFCIAYFIRGFDLYEVFLVTVATLVSVIPEGLPAVISVVLAIGAGRMADRKAVIREFSATETLGAVTTIVTDKTGTLTQSALEVRRVFTGDVVFNVTGNGYNPEGAITSVSRGVDDPLQFPAIQLLAETAFFSNNSELKYDEDKKGRTILGDPTEGALKVFALKFFALDQSPARLHRIDDMPFRSELKMRASLLSRSETQSDLMVVGAPEKVLEKCAQKLNAEGETEELSGSERKNYTRIIEEWSGEAMRVIGLAVKRVAEKKIDTDAIDNLTFLGFAGMYDPPRPEVKESIEICRRAGIRVIMATGDHAQTAKAIALQTGIITGRDDRVLTQLQLEEADKKTFEEAVMNVNVFARLTPGMKLKIADTLQRNGELIAMTGDGVNDAPALRKADVGIAMGIMGTDVARGAAQVILTDDRFATIVSAVEEGRIVFANARKSSFFLITTNFAEILTLITAVSIGFPVPLTATQILWLNLVTDGGGGLALATEKGHGNILEMKPVNRKENLLNNEVLPFMVINSVVMTGLALSAFYYFLPVSEEKARTGAFIVMAFTQLFNVFNMRDLKRSIFEIGIFSNRYVNLALAVSVVLQIMVVEVSFLKNAFGLGRLDILELAGLVALSGLVLAGGELYKLYVKMKKK